MLLTDEYKNKIWDKLKAESLGIKPAARKIGISDNTLRNALKGKTKYIKVSPEKKIEAWLEGREFTVNLETHVFCYICKKLVSREGKNGKRCAACFKIYHEKWDNAPVNINGIILSRQALRRNKYKHGEFYEEAIQAHHEKKKKQKEIIIDNITPLTSDYRKLIIEKMDKENLGIVETSKQIGIVTNTLRGIFRGETKKPCRPQRGKIDAWLKGEEYKVNLKTHVYCWVCGVTFLRTEGPSWICKPCRRERNKEWDNKVVEFRGIKMTRKAFLMNKRRYGKHFESAILLNNIEKEMKKWREQN